MSLSCREVCPPFLHGWLWGGWASSTPRGGSWGTSDHARVRLSKFLAEMESLPEQRSRTRPPYGFPQSRSSVSYVRQWPSPAGRPARPIPCWSQLRYVECLRLRVFVPRSPPSGPSALARVRLYSSHVGLSGARVLLHLEARRDTLFAVPHPWPLPTSMRSVQRVGVYVGSVLSSLRRGCHVRPRRGGA